MFIEEETNADDVTVILGTTISKHSILKEKFRERRYTFLLDEGGFALRGMHESWHKWPCG